MIKECKVVSFNPDRNVIVFDYEGNLIQMTTEFREKSKTVFVDYKNGKYNIVTKNDMEEISAAKRKKALKKEIDVAEETVVESDVTESNDMN